MISEHAKLHNMERAKSMVEGLNQPRCREVHLLILCLLLPHPSLRVRASCTYIPAKAGLRELP